MNRIILIGNGFDLAHGLPTGYLDFMKSYWTNVASILRDKKGSYIDDFVKAYIGEEMGEFLPNGCSYNTLKESIDEMKHRFPECVIMVEFKNDFFEHISEQTRLQNWLDIENEYYTFLKSHLTTPNGNKSIKKLNEEFCQVKNLLENYLTAICEKELPLVKPSKELVEYLFLKNGIERKCVALSKQSAYAESIPNPKEKLLKLTNEFIQKEEEDSDQKQIQAYLTGRRYVKNPLCEMDENELEQETEQSIERMGIDPQHILALNFNYTPTFEKLYAPCAEIEIINIHGELNNPTNPIVFGYGDELDDDYKEIEKTNDNDILDNIKSVAYGNTDNYRRLLDFLQLGSFQAFILGHSCGNSDRTLLNEIFEHPNCASIKQFYYDREDGSDDYSNIYKNISRNFNNKKSLRDIVVNKTYCKPLPQSGKIDS